MTHKPLSKPTWLNRYPRKSLAAFVLLSCVVVTGSWWAWFRPLAYDNPMVGVISIQRWFGRVTAIEVDSNRDGKTDALAKYSWADPYLGNLNGPGCLDNGRHSEDRNHDGQWDTWFHAKNVDASQSCIYSISADTDLDGVADFHVESTELSPTFAEIEQLRGF